MLQAAGNVVATLAGHTHRVRLFWHGHTLAGHMHRVRLFWHGTVLVQTQAWWPLFGWPFVAVGPAECMLPAFLALFCEHFQPLAWMPAGRLRAGWLRHPSPRMYGRRRNAAWHGLVGLPNKRICSSLHFDTLAFLSSFKATICSTALAEQHLSTAAYFCPYLDMTCCRHSYDTATVLQLWGLRGVRRPAGASRRGSARICDVFLPANAQRRRGHGEWQPMSAHDTWELGLWV